MAVPFAVITLLLVLVVSLLIIHTGTIALAMTGMSEDVASFQAASAFSGAGFTTDEAEQVVSHPQRRRIVKLLMRAGSVGVVTAIASLVLSFSRSKGSALPKFSSLVVGTVVIVLFLRSQWFKRGLSPALGRLLTETTTLNRNEYAHLLDLREGYRVSELTVGEDGWLSHESLRDLHPADEGVVVLGITRQDGAYAVLLTQMHSSPPVTCSPCTATKTGSRNSQRALMTTKPHMRKRLKNTPTTLKKPSFPHTHR
jgi:hypothetical protein